MPVYRSATHDPDKQLATLAADLTDAAYSVALHYGIGGSWIDLQLDVWRVLARTIVEAGGQSSPPDSVMDFSAWRDALLSALTEAAYETALRHQLQGPFLDVEVDLYHSLQQVLEHPEPTNGLRQMFAPRARIVAEAVLSRLDHQHADCRSANPATGEFSTR